MTGPDGPAVLLEEAATGRPVQAMPVLSAAGTAAAAGRRAGPARPRRRPHALRARFGGAVPHG